MRFNVGNLTVLLTSVGFHIWEVIVLSLCSVWLNLDWAKLILEMERNSMLKAVKYALDLNCSITYFFLYVDIVAINP